MNVWLVVALHGATASSVLADPSLSSCVGSDRAANACIGFSFLQSSFGRNLTAMSSTNASGSPEQDNTSGNSTLWNGDQLAGGNSSSPMTLARVWSHVQSYTSTGDASSPKKGDGKAAKKGKGNANAGKAKEETKEEHAQAMQARTEYGIGVVLILMVVAKIMGFVPGAG